MKNILISTLFLLVATVGSNAEQSPESKPNILLLLVDDMSVYGLSSYGDKPWKTPHIDRLAENGMKWTNAYVYPVCSPTRAALLTGRNPIRSGVTNWIPGWSEKTENPALLEHPFPDHLSLAEYTVAEALRDGGYRTALVGKWHVGEDPIHHPEHQGFEYSYMIATGNTDNYFVEKDQRQVRKFSRHDQPDRQFITEHFADRAIEWLESQDANKPWFLFFSTHIVHTPVLAKESLVDKYRQQGLPEEIPDSATYAAMHEHMDSAIGRLLDHIRTAGMEENTLIVFLSDNGGREPQTTNAPLRGGKGELLEGGIRTPLIFQWPGRIQPGTTNDGLTVADDLFPTFLDVAGLPLPENIELDGYSLLTALTRQRDSSLENRTIYFHYPHYTANPYGEPSSALRQGNWKLLHLLENPVPELYDLSKDPGESDNLAEKRPQLRDQLFQKLNEWKDRHGVQPLDPNPDYDPAKPTFWNGELQSPGKDQASSE